MGAARRGRAFMKEQLELRGATVREIKDRRLSLLEVTPPGSPKSSHVRVKTRQSGTWQLSVSDGSPDPVSPAIPTFWALVDFKDDRRVVFVVPDRDVRREIHAGHQRYLERHGGKRALNDASNHHALGADRIQTWRERWDLLGLEAALGADA